MQPTTSEKKKSKRKPHKSNADESSQDLDIENHQEEETMRHSKRKQDDDTESDSAPKKARKSLKSHKSTQDDAEIQTSNSRLPTPEDTEETEENSAQPTTEDTNDLALDSRGRPRKPRKSRQSEKNNNTIGFFGAEEVQRLEAFKVAFCNEHGLSPSMFDDAIQHSTPNGSGWPGFECASDLGKKQQFWARIHEVLPRRDTRSLSRFARRHFQGSLQKAHEWSKEQEEELIALYQKFGSRFAYIARLIGRSEDDVVQRWKNRLQHRHVQKRGFWTEKEARTLMNLVEDVWKTNKMLGIDVGKDVYEMRLSDINWGNISNKMKNTRSRQQTADKWRKILAIVRRRRMNGDPDAVYDPATVDRKRGSQTPATRSNSVVQDSSDDEFHDAIDTTELTDIDIMQPPQSSPEASPEASPTPDNTTPPVKMEMDEEPVVEAEAKSEAEDPVTPKNNQKRDQRNKEKKRLFSHKREQAMEEEPVEEQPSEDELPPLPPSNPEQETARKEAKKERKRMRAERRESRRQEKEQHEKELQEKELEQEQFVKTEPASPPPTSIDDKVARKEAKKERKRLRAERRESRRERQSLNAAIEI
ncbi:hypothetical protein N7495_008491 [Penicillium taxi]|uniref:uncharacterized protein n=1 Tax=Penicillium taxi TaxID=168475 RepID=UPI002544F13B|nr:uncharacterized protein N7495_008491 [Penicillium taxi]KAJ5888450.1 hypothetical protein N7495_008491 [Penicillium taxi]